MEENTDILRRAMDLRLPISFRYMKEGRNQGKRIGNPHAMFISTKGIISIDIYQTNGASDHPDNIPGWRPFHVQFLQDITIFSDQPEFEDAPGYRPNSPKYSNLIKKV